MDPFPVRLFIKESEFSNSEWKTDGPDGDLMIWLDNRLDDCNVASARAVPSSSANE